MIDRLEILASNLRWLVSRNRWSARLLGLKPVVGHADEPGLVLVQVDGLGQEVFRRALAAGKMPFTRHLVEDDGYGVHRLYSGMASNTPCFQAELFYGVPGAVPGFGYRDAELDREVAMTQPAAASAVESRLREQGRGLLEGGSSWSNIYAGGAAESNFCSATAGPDAVLRALNPLRLLGLVVWHGWSVVRVTANLVAETALALWDLGRGAIAGRNLRQELRFIPERVLVTAVLREIVTAGACVDAERGLPVIHLNLLGYDEHAHRRGPDSRFALWTLRGIDRTIKRVWMAAHRSRHREYQVWVYSDHGQEPVRAYAARTGEDLADAVGRVWQELYGGGGGAPRAGRAAPPPGAASTRSERPRWIREELPDWWRGGRPLPEEPDEEHPLPEGEPAVLHKGPIGFAYLPADFPPERLGELGAAVARHAGVPLVLARDGADGVRVWTWEGREHRLPGDEAEVFGADHPHLASLPRDVVRLVHHPDAGDLAFWSWHPRLSLSFKIENGAHGGPGPRETSAFLVTPPETNARVPRGRTLRALDLRELALDLLDPERSHLPAAREKRRKRRPAALRLMTYNVHGCRGMDGRYSVERIARAIAREHPDVVCLQEVDRDRVRSGGVDQVHEIARRLQKDFHFHGAAEVDDGHFGNAVLSWLPMRHVEEGALPRLETRLALERRGVLWVEIEVGGRPVQILDTHLSIVERERRLQVEELAEWVLRAGARGPLLLAGDLNATRPSYTGRRLSEMLFDVVELDPDANGRAPQTWSGRVPVRRIDHVFASSHFRVRGVRAPRTRLTRVASDHLPLVVELDLGG